MCGIVGIHSQTPVASELHECLIHLQHRGQDAAGILTSDTRFYPKHGLGLVREIFTPSVLATLHGHVGIAHTRYPTAGGYSANDVQPLWIGSPRGVALAHNGNIVNYPDLVDEISVKQHRHLNSSLDSEALLHLLADQLASGSYAQSDTDFFEQLCIAVKHIYDRVKGSYSVVSVVMGKGLVAFRDPNGIRPLVLGERVHPDGKKDWIFASETTPFYSLGFQPLGDLAPGEVAFVSQSGELFRRVLTNETFRPCVFEYVYFARPDATLNGVSVYRSRLRMGQNLAKTWKEKFPDSLPDVVIPVPFTANTAALSFAHELGVRYSEGLYKNPFIGRTFIMPNQTVRSRSVRHKLTPQKTEIENKIVLVIDDSIVRGTTSREIVKMIRENGAKAVYLVSSCPPIMHPCYYGIDLHSQDELIAANQTQQAIADYLKVDRLLYQTEAGLVEAVTRRGDHRIEKPCMACMDGDYVCGAMSDGIKKAISQQRATDKQSARVTE